MVGANQSNSIHERFKIAAIQMTSGMELEENLSTAEKLIVDAKNSGADVVVLPEYFALMPNSNTQRANVAEMHGSGRVQQFLSEIAKDQNIWVVGGSHPIKSNDARKFFGRCYVYNPQGEQLAHYDKVHLFDVSVKEKTEQYCESDYTQPGFAPLVFSTPWTKIGVAICYDLRFPEYFRHLVDNGAEVILVPAAFTQTTGKLHWHTLLKARAVENLSYLVASAQSGTHQNGRTTYGHSCIYSPWGELLSELDSGQGIVVSDIKLDYLRKLRNEFPALTHRRL